MSPPDLPEIDQLLQSLFEERSRLDRVHGQDHHLDILNQIAETHAFQVVPEILASLASDDAQAPLLARVVAALMRDITPVQLSWLDEQVRHRSDADYSSERWHQLGSGTVWRLAQAAEFDATVLGLLTSHANGFVRATALELLAQHTSGEELPFLSLRANDWVEPVAPSVRTAAVRILSNHASRVNFDLVTRRVSSLSDPKARRNVLRVFLDAPKWDAPAFLLETLTDADDEVRSFATRLIDRWIETFNRNYTQPTARQLQRIGGLLDSVSSRLPEQTAKMLRFYIKPS